MQKNADFGRKYMVSMLSAFETVHCIQADPVQSETLLPAPFPSSASFFQNYMLLLIILCPVTPF